jgi:DNA-binding NarL/FixJ family response regulator
VRPCRVLIVDDSPFFLEAARCLVTSFPEIVVVGAATSGREALEQAVFLQPDLVLTDLAMPDVDGLEVVRQLARRPRRPRVILMTAYDDPEYRAAAERAGACAFVTKSDLAARLLPLIHALIPDCGEAQTRTLGGPHNGSPAMARTMVTRRIHVVSLIRATVSNPSLRQALIDLFVALLRGPALIDGGDPPEARGDALLDLWGDEDHLYIEARLPEAFASEIDINIDERRLFIRLGRCVSALSNTRAC